ncbi:protein-disulfide reductase DsbD family protein [Pseudomonadales bacterium]|nr:protein-disulfide reductase DsbD family protein [Pseudomonadales bacterium]
MTNHLTLSFLLILASLPLALNSAAGGLESDANKPLKSVGLSEATAFLPVDDAFTFSLNSDDDSATLVWIIAPEHYLYRHAFSVAIDITHSDGSIKQIPLTAQTLFSQGIKTTDDYFGPVQIYYYQATAQLPMEQIKALASHTDGSVNQRQLSIQYQGCAEAGLCYPVQTRQIQLP